MFISLWKLKSSKRALYFNFRYLWRVYYYLNHLYHEKIINSSDGPSLCPDHSL